VTISGTGVIPVVVFGGTGNDNISGSSTAAAVITAYGEQGQDTLQGGAAADMLFGGDDSDTFVWNPGGNNDSMEGGSGTDALIAFGTSGVDCFHLSPDGTYANRLRLEVDVTGNLPLSGSLLGADIDHVSLIGGAAADFFEISSMIPTTVSLVDIDMGADVGTQDIALVRTSNAGSVVTATPSATNANVDVNGLSALIRLYNTNTADLLAIQGGYGNDQISVAPQTLALISVQVDGGGGNDLISGTSLAYGGDGDDTLIGTAGPDTLLGGLGNDSLSGLAGNDLLLGDAQAVGIGNGFVCGAAAITPPFAILPYSADGGNDTVRGGDGNDLINGGAAEDMLYGDNGDDRLGFLPQASNAILPSDFDEPGDDTISGGRGLDSVFAAAGDDTITGDADNDVIRGGVGNDSADGGTGHDTLYGEAGDDTMLGAGGADSIYGGSGDDSIGGGDGNDTLYGEAGNDTIAGNAGDDQVYGGIGADLIDGNDGNDVLCGGPDASENVDPTLDGSDTIFGGAGNDAANGEYGDDYVNGGTGDDQLWGGEGNDHIGVFTYQSVVMEEPGNDTMIGGAGDDVIAGSMSITDGNDSIFGQDGNDTLWGGAGNDQIYGSFGDDTMLGGTPLTANVLHSVRNRNLPNDGNDTMLGGDGFDQVDGGNGNNVLDAGDDGIRETVLAGTGNDIGYNHMYTDPTTYDILALDGGRNTKYHNGGLVEPFVPQPVCEYVNGLIMQASASSGMNMPTTTKPTTVIAKPTPKPTKTVKTIPTSRAKLAAVLNKNNAGNLSASRAPQVSPVLKRTK
jgi:Ca2+-binding RTX toxin-like protein